MRRQLAWISAGYAAALAAAALSVWVRNLFVSPADQLAMSGMLAAGDSIQFVLVAGALGLVPTFFLLRLLAQGWPRALAWALLAVAATGPLGWLVMAGLVKFPVMPRAFSELVGLALVLLVFPRRGLARRLRGARLGAGPRPRPPLPRAAGRRALARGRSARARRAPLPADHPALGQRP